MVGRGPYFACIAISFFLFRGGVRKYQFWVVGSGRVGSLHIGRGAFLGGVLATVYLRRVRSLSAEVADFGFYFNKVVVWQRLDCVRFTKGPVVLSTGGAALTPCLAWSEGLVVSRGTE